MKKDKSSERIDNFINTYNKLGESDNITRSVFSGNARLTEQEVNDIFTAHWINRRAVEVIAEDSLRQGIKLNIDDEDIIKKVNGKLEELNVLNEYEKAIVLARMYGGSLVILGINDGQTPEQPLNSKNIKSLDYLFSIDRHKIVIESKYNNPLKPNFNQPELYSVTDKNGKKYVIHESRTIRFDGDFIPDKLMDENSGWQDSIYVAIQETLKQYASAMSSGATLFQDFVTKVLKMPNLTELVKRQKTGDNSLEKRIQFASSKMANHNIVLVGDDEEYTKIATSVAGLKELMDLYIEAVCGAIETPRTRLFGQQLGVLAGATEQTRNYYDTVKKYQVKKIKPQFETLLKYILIIENGKEPEDWSWEFNPLWQDSQKELLEQKKLQADIDNIYLSQGVTTPEEIAVSRFTDRGYSFDTNIEIDLRESSGEQGAKTTPDSE